jgi:hypothetical protein
MCHMAIDAHRKRKNRECIGNRDTFIYIYNIFKGVVVVVIVVIVVCRERACAPRTRICTRRGPVQRSAPHLPRRRDDRIERD